jgi:phosphate transport system protein
MSRQTIDEIRRLSLRLDGQSHRVLRQVEDAVRALSEFVEPVAVEALEEEIDREEVLLEEECLRVMALHHPIGSDLRFLTTLIRANVDLERAADHAQSAFRLSVGLVGKAPDSIALLSRMSLVLLRDSIQALLDRDPRQASAVLASTEQLQTLSDAAVRQSRTLADSGDSGALDRAFLSLRVAMDFRRIGDLACNLAEDALYLERGNIVRHGQGASATGP